MTTANFTYRTYIERELESRCRRNPRYSLRALARDLGIHASKLSEVLNRQCGLSAESAAQLSQRLKLSEVEVVHFVTLVEAEHSRSHVRKTLAVKALEKFQQVHGYGELDLERFKIISDWYHFAILELTEVEGFKSNPGWIARRLGVPIEKIKNAIERLLEFGLLQEDSLRNLKQTNIDLATPSGVPSRELREHHAQILSKAMESIEKNNVHERDLSSTTMSIDATQLDEAKKMIKEFRRQFAKKFQTPVTKNRVFCLSIQFFPLDSCNNQHDSKETLK